MFLSNIYNKLFSNALTTRKDMAIFYSRSAILTLLSACFISYNNLFVINLEKSLGLYGGLFNITSLTQSFSFTIFILLLSPIILVTVRLLFILTCIIVELFISIYKVYKFYYIQHHMYINNKLETLCYGIFLLFFTCISIYIYDINTSSTKTVVFMLSYLSVLFLLLCTLSINKKKLSLLDILYYVVNNKKYTISILLLFRSVMYLLQYLFGCGLEIPQMEDEYIVLVRFYTYISCLFSCIYLFHILSQLRYIPNWVNLDNNNKGKVMPTFSPLAINCSVFQILLLSSGFFLFQVYISPIGLEYLNTYSSSTWDFLNSRITELLKYKSSYFIRSRTTYNFKSSVYNPLSTKVNYLYNKHPDNILSSGINMDLVYKVNRIYVANYNNIIINKTRFNFFAFYNKSNSTNKGLLITTPTKVKLFSIAKDGTNQVANVELNYPKFSIQVYNLTSHYSRDIVRLRSFVNTDFDKLLQYRNKLYEVFYREYRVSTDSSLVLVNKHLEYLNESIRSLCLDLHQSGTLPDHWYIIMRTYASFAYQLENLDLLSSQVETINNNFSILYGMMGLLTLQKDLLNVEQLHEMSKILTFLDREHNRYKLIRNYINYNNKMLFKWELLVSDEIEKVNNFLFHFFIFAYHNSYNIITRSSEVQVFLQLIYDLRNRTIIKDSAVFEAKVIIHSALNNNLLPNRYKYNYENLYLLSQLPLLSNGISNANITGIYPASVKVKPTLANKYFYRKVVMLERQGVTQFNFT